MEKFVLGSASPRRQRLLSEAGFDFEVVKTDAPEISDSSNPVGTVVHNAVEKNIACRFLRPDSTILTADTLVWFRGRLIGKPQNEDEAVSFLRAFSGNEQTVFTAVALSTPQMERPMVRVEASLVCFKVLSDDTIKRYLDAVQPYDRAGAYDANEDSFSIIEKIVGSFSNVVGLPMEMTKTMLGEVGVG